MTGIFILKLSFMAALIIVIYLTAKLFKYDKRGNRADQIEEQFREVSFRRNNKKL